MNTYLIRVTSDEADRVQLLMTEAGFSRYARGDDGVRVRLAPGEFSYEGPDDIPRDAVLSGVRGALEPLERPYGLVVSEAARVRPLNDPQACPRANVRQAADRASTAFLRVG